MLLFGYLCFFIAYGGMAICAAENFANIPVLLILFGVYGIYIASTDGVSKAWVSLVCKKEDKGVALGLFAGFSSIAILIASVAAGIIWTLAGPLPVFIIPATASFIAIIYLTFVVHSPVREKNK